MTVLVFGVRLASSLVACLWRLGLAGDDLIPAPTVANSHGHDRHDDEVISLIQLSLPSLTEGRQKQLHDDGLDNFPKGNASHVNEHPDKKYNWGLNWDEWYDDMMQVFPPSGEGYEIINYGLTSEPLHPCAASVPAGEPGRGMPFNHTTGANMYATLASKSPVSLTNASVLEISSGRGGGAALLSDCFCPSRMLGVDYTSQEVLSAQSRYGRNGSCPIQFVQGDAMGLPFESESFDVVVNVEASHAYANYRKFIQEAHRVLRPGGAFLSADFRYVKDLNKDITIMKDVFQQIVHPENITAMVLTSLTENRLRIPWVQECEAVQDSYYFNSVKHSFYGTGSVKTYSSDSASSAAPSASGSKQSGLSMRSKNHSGDFKLHAHGLGLANAWSCPFHAGSFVEPKFRDGKMAYMMYVLSK